MNRKACCENIKKANKIAINAGVRSEKSDNTDMLKDNTRNVRMLSLSSNVPFRLLSPFLSALLSHRSSFFLLPLVFLPSIRPVPSAPLSSSSWARSIVFHVLSSPALFCTHFEFWCVSTSVPQTRLAEALLKALYCKPIQLHINSIGLLDCCDERRT